MTLKDTLLKAVSYIVPGKVFRGYGISTDPMPSNTGVLNKDPVVPKATNLLFYSLRKDLGAFEITGVAQKKDVVRFIITHIETGQEFSMPKKYFELFFEEIKHEPFKIPER